MSTMLPNTPNASWMFISIVDVIAALGAMPTLVVGMLCVGTASFMPTASVGMAPAPSTGAAAASRQTLTQRRAISQAIAQPAAAMVMS